MLEVHHYPLCPFSRKLRVVLKEKDVPFELFYEPYWERRRNFLKLNPLGMTPVIVKEDRQVIFGNYAMFEYLEEVYNHRKLIPDDINGRLAVRKVCEWFDVKFFNEVTRYILNEKIIKTVARLASPNSQAIQAAKKNIYYHLEYINFLLEKRHYLCTDDPTLADFAAAAQLSVIDFVGDIPWEHQPRVKEWYALIKSRPGFKPILFDKLPNFTTPGHYTDPDF